MREETQTSGERYERGVGMTARATHHAFGFAFSRVMHRADLTWADTGTAFGLLVVIRRRAAGRHRHDAHGGELARKPDDGDGPQKAPAARARRQRVARRSRAAERHGPGA